MELRDAEHRAELPGVAVEEPGGEGVHRVAGRPGAVVRLRRFDVAGDEPAGLAPRLRDRHGIGAAILPVGRRRETLVLDIERMLRDAIENRVLPFDSEAAGAYADIAAARRSSGRPVPPANCQIAAIARSRGMAMATRNVRDFEDIDIEVVDPWACQ